MALSGTSVEPSGGGDSLAEVGSWQELGVCGVGKFEVLQAGLISSLCFALPLDWECTVTSSLLRLAPHLPHSDSVYILGKKK